MAQDGRQVLASLGHVCDISPKSGAVNVKNGFEVNWEMSETGQKCVGEISDALKGASHLILATDPDREGEAISWHVVEQLKSLGSLQQITIERITFNQISEDAVMKALAHPRTVQSLLCQQYMSKWCSRSIRVWWMRTWLEESSIISWDSRCRLFCGGSCVEHDRQVMALRFKVQDFDRHAFGWKEEYSRLV